MIRLSAFLTAGLAVAAACTLASLPVSAQEDTAAGHQVHGTAGMDGSGDQTAPGSMHAAMEEMDRGMMAVGPSGDLSVDFARMMIPHHQGAIDMARLYLEQGDDPVLRQMAEDIVASQEAEIRTLQDWLAAHAP